MGSSDAPTEMFRDLWLPPVETPAELPADVGDDHLCLVREDGRTWVRADGAWRPVGPPRSPAKSKPLAG